MRQYRWHLFAPLALAALASAGNGAQAQKSLDVVELFTSQGCSSCPPADKLFKQFTARKDLVALSFNVDYWDYLGWKDTLAQRTFSERQRTYAEKRGDGAVYTPQMVINGIAHAVGSRQPQIQAALSKSSAKLEHRRVAMDLQMSGETLEIRIPQSDRPPAKAATVWLASILPSVKVKIRHGENRGHAITYYNVVRNLTAVGMWSGEAANIKLPRRHALPKKNMQCAIILQADDGAILAANWLQPR